MVDVGSGTGVLGLSCAHASSYTLLIDVNPCAVLCSKRNAAANRLDAVTDVVQCDNVTCLRSLGGGLLVYNTPYLPVEDAGCLGAAWSGGLREALRAAQQAPRLGAECIVLVYSSLSGDDRKLLGLLEAQGFRAAKKRLHVFFEDIVVASACRERSVVG